MQAYLKDTQLTPWEVSWVCLLQVILGDFRPSLIHHALQTQTSHDANGKDPPLGDTLGLSW